MSGYLLAIDQGTTSSRAVIYDNTGQSRGAAGGEFPQHYPQAGWVEHDMEDIWATVAEAVPRALKNAGITATDVTAIGLTNQRETVVVWDRATGDALGRAIVWQDRRTADFCRKHHKEEDWIRVRTGLVLDPYFSATKIHWRLDQDADLRRRAEAGEIACATIDSWLIWKLTGGRQFCTDVTNASRTLLVDIGKGDWDEDLCKFFQVPRACLPEIQPSASDFGKTHGLDFLPDGIPISGVAGDQQAALFGQCGFDSGDAKCTYGTGAFFLQHTGSNSTRSQHRLLTSIAASVDANIEYVLEGSVFIAGAAVQWLRDGLKIITDAAQVEQLAQASDPDEPIIFVPGFVGLGAPYWVPEVQGTVFGLTRGATAADLARGALEGVAFQIADLVNTAGDDSGARIKQLRVDGGMARNKWFVQRQADILGLPVLQVTDAEATARGAAYLAGLQAGVWPDKDSLRQLGGATNQFTPTWTADERKRRLQHWQRAIKAVIAYHS